MSGALAPLIPACGACGANGDENGVLIHVLDATFTTACRSCGHGFPSPLLCGHSPSWQRGDCCAACDALDGDGFPEEEP